MEIGVNDMQETVALPDPAVKRLPHPTDLPDARELYRRGWWFGRVMRSVVVSMKVLRWR
ncbi:hypothetical protein ACIBPB_09970 [Micromonospora sp. NPDC049836]|uniref:hypothetical protein n=1 Tax=Micromonospora sp. NPDC049836 TaxID=3364274 RepID=UPI0037BBBED1